MLKISHKICEKINKQKIETRFKISWNYIEQNWIYENIGIELNRYFNLFFLIIYINKLAHLKGVYKFSYVSHTYT